MSDWKVPLTGRRHPQAPSHVCPYCNKGLVGFIAAYEGAGHVAGLCMYCRSSFVLPKGA